MAEMVIKAVQGSTQTTNATSTPVSITVDTSRTNIRVLNKGPNVCFVRWSISADGTPINPSTADLPIAVNVPEIIDIGQADTVSFMCPSTDTATVYTAQLIED
jgi:hypothetical protein